MRWRSGACAPREEPSRSRLGASHNQPSDEEEEAPMDRQYVGIDFHRRRSVIVRVSAAGEKLSGVRVANDALAMAGAVAEAGPDPEVVVEATYGWYWVVDLLQANGARVHLANPQGLNGGQRRVKNDERDAIVLADMLRLGRLPGVGTLGRVELPCGENRHQASRVVVCGPVDPDPVATLRHDRQGPHHAGGMNRAVRERINPCGRCVVSVTWSEWHVTLRARRGLRWTRPAARTVTRTRPPSAIPPATRRWPHRARRADCRAAARDRV